MRDRPGGQGARQGARGRLTGGGPGPRTPTARPRAPVSRETGALGPYTYGSVRLRRLGPYTYGSGQAPWREAQAAVLEGRELLPGGGGLRRVELHGEHLLGRPGLGQHLAPGVDDDAVARLLDPGVGAGRTDRQDVRLVLDRAGLGQQRPVRAAALRPAGRDDQGLGARVDQPPEQLGEAQVVAGGEAERGLRQGDGDEFARPRPSSPPRPCRSRSGGSCGRRRPARPRGRTPARCCRGCRPSARSTKDPACSQTPASAAAFAMPRASGPAAARPRRRTRS